MTASTRTPRVAEYLRAWALAHEAAGISYYADALDDPNAWAGLEQAYAKDQRERAAEHYSRPIEERDLVTVDEDLLKRYTQRKPTHEARKEIRHLEHDARRDRRAAGRRQHQRAAVTGWDAAEREHDPIVVMSAIPQGSRPVESKAIALEALIAYEPWQQRRADARGTLHALYEHLVLAMGPTGTTSPGEASALEKLKIHRDTYYEHLAWLIRHGFLGVVCSGLSRNYAGKKNRARRAVYVVCVPFAASAPAALKRVLDDAWGSVRARGASFVDVLTPTPSELSPRTNPTRAREQVEQPSMEPLRGPSPTMGGPEARHRPPKRYRSLVLESVRLRKKRPEGCIQLAERLRDTHLVFRSMSLAAVAQYIAPFVAAGDTDADLAYRLDNTPQGLQPHSGFDGARKSGAVVRYRLGFWITPAGSVMPTPGQLRRSDLERRARVRALARLSRGVADMQARRSRNDPAHLDRIELARQLLHAEVERGRRERLNPGQSNS